MRPWVWWCQSHYPGQSIQSALCLILTAVILHDVFLMGRNSSKRRGTFILIWSCVLHLGRDSLRLLLSRRVIIGFGQQTGNFHFWRQVLFTLVMWTRRPYTGINGSWGNAL